MPRPLVQLARFMYVVFMVFAALVMVALAAVGLLEIVLGVAAMANNQYHYLVHGPSQHANGDVAIQLVLKGIECLFLAPVSILTIHCIAIYLMGRFARTRDSRHIAPEADDRPVIEMKAWTLSLMIAVVATDVIGRLISGSIFEVNRVVAECALILVLSFVWWLVYGHHGPHYRQPPDVPHREQEPTS